MTPGEAVEAHVRANPGCTQGEIAAATGAGAGNVSKTCGWLVRAGRIAVVTSGAVLRYHIAGADLPRAPGASVVETVTYTVQIGGHSHRLSREDAEALRDDLVATLGRVRVPPAIRAPTPPVRGRPKPDWNAVAAGLRAASGGAAHLDAHRDTIRDVYARVHPASKTCAVSVMVDKLQRMGVLGEEQGGGWYRLIPVGGAA